MRALTAESRAADYKGRTASTVMSSSLPPISPLRGLLEVTRLLRAQEDLPELLAAIARVTGESLGYRTVAINLYRPEWDDFCVTTVHGSDDARRALLGRIRAGDDWEQLLREEFRRRERYAASASARTTSATIPATIPNAMRWLLWR